MWIATRFVTIGILSIVWPLKRLNLHILNTPFAEISKVKNAHSAHSPSTQQQDPASGSRDRLAELKDRSFVFRIKKEKDRQLASKQYLSKQSN